MLILICELLTFVFLFFFRLIQIYSKQFLILFLFSFFFVYIHFPSPNKTINRGGFQHGQTTTPIKYTQYNTTLKTKPKKKPSHKWNHKIWLNENKMLNSKTRMRRILMRESIVLLLPATLLHAYFFLTKQTKPNQKSKKKPNKSHSTKSTITWKSINCNFGQSIDFDDTLKIFEPKKYSNQNQ